MRQLKRQNVASRLTCRSAGQSPRERRQLKNVNGMRCLGRLRLPQGSQDISLRDRKFHLTLCSPTSAITYLKEEAMGPWWKYRFFRQKSVLAHNSIWTNFSGHINFKQAIKYLKRVGNDSCARRGLERYFNSHRSRYGPNCRLGRNYRNRRFPSCCIKCCCRDGQQRDRESNTPPHALSPRA